MAERGRASGPRILFSTDGDVSVGEANQATERAAAKVIVRGTWQTFRLSVIGATLGLDVDGKTVTRKTVSVTNGGRLALYAAAGTGAPHIEFKDLWLRELGPDAKPVDGGGR
jgi:hypothetical protein